MSSSASFENNNYYDVTKYGSASNLDGGGLRRSPTAYSRYSYEPSGFPAQRQKGKATTTAADRYYDTTSYNKNSTENYGNGTSASGRESRVDFRRHKTSDQSTGSGFPAQRPPNQSLRASASMSNLRQDANDGLGSRATTTTEQDFRYSNDGASLSRSDPFYRDTSVNIATSGAREFNPEKRESFNSYDYSPKESGYGSSSVNLRASDANLRTQSAARFTSEYRDLYRSSALDLRSPQTDFARSTSYN